MTASPRPELDDDLKVRVVKLSELGAQRSSESGGSLLELLEVDGAHAAPPERAGKSTPPTAPRAAVAPPAALVPSLPATVARGVAPPAKPATPTSVALSTSRPAVETAAAPRIITAGRLGIALLLVALFIGWHFPTERYITPKRGLGYALGIIGGSLMLILLLYSLRKRFAWLRFLGPTPSWFRFHMVLGILGPLCILYHANFSTGATNSNVALFAMLTVAGSGFIGRYIYAHIHHGLYGRKLLLGELRNSAESLRSLSNNISFMPDLIARLDTAERRLLRSGPQASFLGLAKPLVVAVFAVWLRWRLHHYIGRALRASARRNSVLAREMQRLRSVACAYVDRRLAATRRVAGFEGYERLFSLWHALHIPLIFMMIVAAVIHVIAVHVY